MRTRIRSSSSRRRVRVSAQLAKALQSEKEDWAERFDPGQPGNAVARKGLLEWGMATSVGRSEHQAVECPPCRHVKLHTRVHRYGEPSVQADGVGSFGRPRTWAPATPVACKGPEPPREGGRDKPGTHAAAILARVCGGGRQGWRLPNCKGAVPTDSANCSCAPSLLVGVWGAAARSGGDACRCDRRRGGTEK